MAQAESKMLPLGTPAPWFSLPDLDGKPWSLEQAAGAPGLLVMFICNHCPFVIHVREQIVAVAGEAMARGVAVVAINANDPAQQPRDSREEMRLDAERFAYPFPYLVDEDQMTAKAFRAACTPEFYLFDGARELVYRGRLDGAQPGNDVPVSGEELRRALDSLLGGEGVVPDQRPSIGCSIKWR